MNFKIELSIFFCFFFPFRIINSIEIPLVQFKAEELNQENIKATYFNKMKFKIYGVKLSINNSEPILMGFSTNHENSFIFSNNKTEINDGTNLVIYNSFIFTGSPQTVYLNEITQTIPFSFLFLTQKMGKDFNYEKRQGILSFLRVYRNSENKAFDIVDTLYLHHAISSNTFAITFYPKNAKLYLGEDFKGKYEKCKYERLDTPNFFFNLKREDTTWICHFNKFSVGNHSETVFNDFVFNLLENQIVIPYVPGNIILSIVAEASRGKCKEVIDYVYILLVCQKEIDFDSLPSLKLFYGKAHLTLKWKFLFTDSPDCQEYVSLIVVNRIGLVTWIIGNPVLNGNIIFFEKGEGDIGFINGDEYFKSTQQPFNVKKKLYILIIFLCSSEFIMLLIKWRSVYLQI